MIQANRQSGNIGSVLTIATIAKDFPQYLILVGAGHITGVVSKMERMTRPSLGMESIPIAAHNNGGRVTSSMPYPL